MIDKKAINYYSSFYEVSKDLTKDQFYHFNMAIFKVMFFDEHIDTITFKDAVLNLLWKSIKHSIQSSVEGYCSKKNIPYDECDNPLDNPLDNKRKRKDNEEEKEEEKEEEGINPIALDEWFKYKGSRYSKQGKTLTINFLKEYSEDQQLEIVRASIMNNWKGLFEPKQKSKTSGVSQIDQMVKENKISSHAAQTMAAGMRIFGGQND